MSRHDEARDDLQATAASVQAEAERLAELECDKLARDPDDPEVATISREASRLGRRIRSMTAAEADLSAELEASPEP